MNISDGPESLRYEHEELHEQLDRAIRSGGATGDAARQVLEVVGPHVRLEESFAIPPLMLLPALASGLVPDDIGEILEQSARLKEELAGMLADHQRIVGALKRLMQAAIEEKKAGFADFARRLILHAQMEEEILYPAAILVGDYVRLLRERG